MFSKPLALFCFLLVLHSSAATDAGSCGGLTPLENLKRALGILTCRVKCKDRDLLHEAISNDNLASVEELVEGGADIECLDGFKRSPLFHAGRINSTLIVEFFISSDVNLEAPVGNTNDTALSKLVAYNYPRVVELLVKAGANVNHINASRETPLMVSSEKGILTTVRLLLCKGAFFDAQDRFGRSALIIAAQFGYVEIVDALLEAGASKLLKTNDGKTALDFALGEGHERIVKLIESPLSSDPGRTVCD